MKQFSILLLVLFLIGCVSQSTNTAQFTQTALPSTASEAQAVLIKFFELLNTKQYTEAASLYSGSYEGLQDNNPSVDPSDHAKLLANACEINGHKCLLARTAIFKELRGDKYVFQVEFSNPDGSLFVRGPCCGANETDMPPESQFEYGVARNADGKFLVMELPPYVP